MSLYFITGNIEKFEEVKELIPDLKQLDIDLPEIQSLDAHEIIKFKLQSALAHHRGPFIVEDTGLYMECIQGLPGPFSKWFTQVLEPKGTYELAKKMGNFMAEARSIIGYAKSADDIHYFEGITKGTIVPPRAKEGFGWDPVFHPEGFDKSFVEMSRSEKNAVSHRGQAVRKLKDFLTHENSL